MLHVRRIECAAGRGYKLNDGPELQDGLRAAICSGDA
jgi:hypothetical protein